MIVGEETPDGGNIDMGETVKVGYVDQRHADIDPNRAIVGGRVERQRAGGDWRPALQQPGVRQQVQLQWRRPTEEMRRAFQGGERNQLHLAMTANGGQRALA